MWSEPQRGREREKERLIFYTFCTISSLFPPWRPLSAECAEYAFHGQEAMEPARTKKYEKKGRERERERNAPPPSCIAIQKDGIITQKTSPPCFFTFYPGVPGTLSYYYDQNTWTAHRLPALTLRGKKKQMLFVAKCTGLYFCPASRLIGVHVRQPMVDCGWGSTVGRNIRTVV